MPTMDEDAMFKALLKNKPPQSLQTTQKPRIQMKEPARVTEAQVSQTKDTYEPPKDTPDVKSLQIEAVAESINHLTSSVNMIHGLIKNALIVLILILIVGIAILVKA